MMRKLFLLFFALLIPFVAKASCPEKHLALYGIEKTDYDLIREQESGSSYFCWEIAYLIQSNQKSMRFKDYKKHLENEVNLVLPGYSHDLSKLRSLGTPYDFQKLAILKREYKITENDFDAVLQEGGKKILKFYPISYNDSYGTLVKQNTVSISPQMCLSSSDYNTLSSAYPKLSRPLIWEPGSGQLSNIFGTSLAEISDIKDGKATFSVGDKKTSLKWNATCGRVDFQNDWTEEFNSITTVLTMSMFQYVNEFVMRTFDEFADLGKNLVWLFITLWILFYVFKNLWSMKEIMSLSTFLSDFWKTMAFASLYVIVLVGWTPKELVDTFLLPVLELGTFYGKMLFEAVFGYALPTADSSEILAQLGGSSNFVSGLVPPVFDFLNAFTQTIITPILIGESLISYGFSVVSVSTIFIGLGMFILFAWVWYKLFMILFIALLDLMIVMMLFPLLSFALVFPATREKAKSTLINKTVQIASTFAFLPFILVFNSRLTVAFLAQSDPETGNQVSKLLEMGDLDAVARAFDLSFSMVFESFFIGLLIIHITSKAKELLKTFGTVGTANEFKPVYDKYNKTWEQTKKDVKETKAYKNWQKRKERRRTQKEFAGKTADEKRAKFASSRAKSRGKK
ncbi:MAG: hypothetical protein JXR30_02645 [Alphaproteobacteria bacterium]|nr:hypothetical protein [Alphaproteobacteria bacterium]